MRLSCVNQKTNEGKRFYLEAIKLANPLAKDGKIQFDEEAEEKREDEMLKTLRKWQGQCGSAWR